MKNKNIYFLIGLVFLTLFSLNFISAIDACCEKTINGATCVYTDINNCDKTGLLHYDYGACEYLDYCTLGTCIDEDKITCESNTPKATCEERGGLWDSRSKDTIPECQPGCCYYGNDAILTTKAGCNKFEDYYPNLETYFAPGVSMEDCEGSVNLDELGACVQESLGGTKDCQILTKSECSNKESMSDYPVNFYEGYLCTSDILGNICEKTKITECRDNLVYLKDSCGNFANVYDHNKLTLDSYWQTILPKNEFCVGDLTNLNECGNCENGIGSVCVKYEPGKTAVPKDGVNNVCSDSTCTFRGEEKQYGDRWCITNAYKDGEYLPGVTEAVGVCQDGEVTILPCESGMREEICIEQGVGNARCVDNNWEICNGYDNKEDCENPQDFCEWHDASWYNPSDYNSFNERILTFATGTSFELDEYMDTNPVDAFGYCSPKYAPGINFWEFNDESKSEEICTQNSYTCNVIWAELREFAGELKSESGRDKFLEAGFECVDKDGNLREDWLKEMNNKCALSSDCGLKNNFLNKSGKIKELSNFVTREKGDAGEWKLQEADLTWGSVGRFLNAWGNSLANNLIYIRKVPETITFNCNPWEAEYGGENCEVCNTLPLGCSEYECKSLGQYCDVDTDENTGENFCFFKDSNDITPPKITFLPETLSEDFSYEEISDNVIKLKGGTEECIPYFTPFSLKIKTDELAECRLDLETHTLFDDFKYNYDSSTGKRYNHTAYFNIPMGSYLNYLGDLGNAANIYTGEDYEIHTRCIDGNENENNVDFIFKFCVDDAPDNKAPKIVSTDPLINSRIGYNVTEVEAGFLVNELANCSWDLEDKAYDEMPEDNKLICSNSQIMINGEIGFPCVTTLSNLQSNSLDATNTFYVRCVDRTSEWDPDSTRNEMLSSFVYTIKGSVPLVIEEMWPQETISGNTDSIEFKLQAKTLGGVDSGKSVCYYGENNNANIPFEDTNNYFHETTVSKGSGSYEFTIECIDEGKNIATDKINVTVLTDTEAPVIVRMVNEGSQLRIVTDEEAICSYSLENCAKANFEEDANLMQSAISINHYMPWTPDTNIYIRCKDKFEIQSQPNVCSAQIGVSYTTY